MTNLMHKLSLVGAAAAVAVAYIATPVEAVVSTSMNRVSSVPSYITGQIGVIADPRVAGFGLDKVNDIKKVGSDTAGMMYVAGYFKQWVARNGTVSARNNIAGFNPRSGALLPFAPNVNGEIRAIEPSPDGAYLYIGGYFTSVNGVARKYAAKLKLSDGSVDPTWNPAVNNKVEDIAFIGGHLVLTGYFRSVGTVARTNIASVSTTNGAADSWLNLAIKGFAKTPTSSMVHKIAANPAQTAAVIVGNFDTVNGASHRRIAVVNLASTRTSLAPWNTPLTARGALDANGNPTTNATNCTASYVAPEGDVTWTPDGNYFATASTGGRVDIGGVCDAAALWNGKNLTNTGVVVGNGVTINYTGGDSLSGIICTNTSCIISGHERWADNPPMKGTPCADILPPNNGQWAGYDCGGPNAVRRQGMAELRISDWKATAWDPTRGKERSMDNVMLYTSEGLWIGSDANAAGGKNGFNDLVLFPYAP